jgi:V/A-type H+-transporting ATPase subunit A
MTRVGRVRAVAGPVIRASIDFPVRMFEVAHVGELMLMGEVVRIRGAGVDIQVYEETTGVRAGEPVHFSGRLFEVELGPGLLGQVFDGIGRPLYTLGKDSLWIQRGADAATLDRTARWEFTPSVTENIFLKAGDCWGVVREGRAIEHRLMAPPDFPGGVVQKIASEGVYEVEAPLCFFQDTPPFSMMQRWEVRKTRPVAKRLSLDVPLVTGQRILDTLFPLALGGAAVIPGGFGTGKTVTQQSLAKWCNAQVIVYIGCGERGNEMTEVLEEFPTLVDPHNGFPLMERMVLIANTSNMPVAAREASIYLGMSIAEYFRDMGLHVAIMADSTSRWAEALREIGGRLEEMPGEEGYPAYLGSRLAQYYERAGKVVSLGSPERLGSVSVINAVSPPGGDFSEPVTQGSLRLSGVFWSLDKTLAQQRHFPAINWKTSYSLYEEQMDGYFENLLGKKWKEGKRFLREALAREKELLELVQLVGRDGLSETDKWVLFLSELLRVVYLQQNAFDAVDAFCPLARQNDLLCFLRDTDLLVRNRIDQGLLFEQIPTAGMRVELIRLRSEDDEHFPLEMAKWSARFSKVLDETEVIAL